MEPGHEMAAPRTPPDHLEGPPPLLRGRLEWDSLVTEPTAARTVQREADLYLRRGGDRPKTPAAGLCTGGCTTSRDAIHLLVNLYFSV
jgi:hypothetical protein